MGEPNGTTQARIFGGWASSVDGPFTKQGWEMGLTRITAGYAVIRPEGGGGIPRLGLIVPKAPALLAGSRCKDRHCS